MQNETIKNNDNSTQEVSRTFEIFSKSGNTNTTNTAKDLAQKDKNSDKH